MTLRQVTLINNLSGGTSGTPVTAGNSGGVSGNPFDGNFTGTGAILAYDSTHVPEPGLLACKAATTSSATAYANYAVSMTGPNGGAQLAKAWFRAYLYFTGNPSVITPVFSAQQPGGVCASVRVTTTGKVAAYDSAGTQQVITATSIPLGQWFRVEGFVTGSASAGQLSLTLYTGKDSTIAAEGPLTSAATLNTAGTMTAWRFGIAVATASAGPYWIGQPAVSNSGPVGPVGYGIHAIRADDGGCTTNVAVPAAGGAAGRLAVGGDVEGYFTSDNQGSTWAVAGAGLSAVHWRHCATIQWAAKESNTLYSCAGDQGSGGGFLVSQDGGGHWFMRNTDVQFAGNHSGSSLPGPADQSRSTGNVLAQTGNTNGLMYTAGYKNGVWRTNTAAGNGATWTSIGLAGGSHYGRCIAVDPANINNLYCGMYNEGVYKATNASSANPANFALMTGGPKFPEQIVILSSGNMYVAAGYGGAGQAGYAPGGLWQWSASGGWQQFDSAGGSLSASSYWMSLDGYTDASGNDQLIIGCNKAVKNTSGSTAATNNLMWVTVTTTGGVNFSPVTNYLPNINGAAAGATIPPENRTWWHAGSHDVLGGSGMIQPRPVIDKTTINTSNVTVYCAGSSGFWISTGNTIGASGPVTSTTPVWSVSCDGMPLHVGHQLAVNPNNPLQLGWATSDWCNFLITDGVGYNAATTTQGSPPLNPGVGGVAGEGYALAYDPLSGLTGNPNGTVYLSTGTKYNNTDGQIWAQAGTAGAGNSYTNISASGPPFSGTTANPGTSGGQVAYGLCAGRDGSGNPYLLAMIQGSATVGGMYRFSGYSIAAGGTVNTTGGSWSRVNATIGTAGGIPTAVQAPIITDPNQPGVHFCFDQGSGLWRSVNHGTSWALIWSLVNNDTRSGTISVNPAVTSGTELWVSAQGGTSGTKGLFKIPNADTVAAGSGPPAGHVTISGLGGTPGGVCHAPNGDAFCLALDAASGPYLLTQLMTSLDGGSTWQQADNGSVAATASYPSNMAYASNGRIYIANQANTVAFGYPSIPVEAPSAGMTATATLFAQPQDVPGTGKFGNAGLSARASMTVAPPGHTIITAMPLSATAQIAAAASGPVSLIVQQVNGVSAFDYGISSTEMTTTAGNTLVVLAGWDLSSALVTAPMPAVSVSDSAGNYWYHAGTSPSSVTGVRCSAWICPNAAAIEWLSVSLSAFASSMAYTVLELNGQSVLPDGTPAPAGSFLPPLFSLDVMAADAGASAASLALKPGTAADADFAFAVYAIGALSPAQPSLSGWTGLTSVAAKGTLVTSPAGGGGLPPGIIGFPVASLAQPVNSVQIWPYFLVAPAGTGLATTFSVGAQPVPYAGVTFAVRSDVAPPSQTDTSFPVLKVELGLGYTPGDPSQPPPDWTDITSRCMSKDGDSFIQISMGRQYELTAPEAGTITVAAYNGDGALTPGGPNAFPGLALENPLRVSAYWNGSWYAVGYGYVERYPQEWPDLPQVGMSKMVATDAISIMAAVNMVSAMDADTLIDAPYVLLPAAEQYLAFSNGLNSFGGSGSAALGYYHVSDAQGLAAQNVSRVNQRAGLYVDGQGIPPGGSGIAIASTGQTTNLLGTANTGFGTSAIGTTTAPTAPLSGPGIVYTDPGLPDPVTAGGVTVSFWLIIPSTVSFASLQPTVFTAYGPPTSYPSGRASLSVQIMNLIGSNTLKVTLADGTTVSAPFNVSSSPQRITLCLTASSLLVYVNGAQAATASLSAAQTTAWNAVAFGCPNYAYGSAGTVAGNFTVFGLAIHACQLPAQRIVSEFNTGISGQQNAGAVQRVAQILSWAGLGLPRAGRQTFNGGGQDTLQGPAYSLAGTSAASAAAQVALNESGMLAAQPTGELEFIHRWALLNQSPAVVFGDNTDPTAGEVPYQPSQSWGFDNSYLASVVSVAQQYGPNTLFTATGADLVSEAQYFPRAGPSQTIQTMSALDATGQVNWALGKYSQPSLRAAALTVNAAASPQLAFPAVLALRQGQVATVIRRPVGAPVMQQNCLVQKISHAIGGKSWVSSYQLSPYSLEAQILQLDVPGFDSVGSNALA